MGACQLKNTVCYVWLFDLMMRKDKSVCCGLLNAWDTITLTVTAIYFLYWNRNWFNLCLGMTILGAISHFYMLIYAPESPKWLLVQNRREDAIIAFNKIAEFNRSKNFIPQNA